jgi:hypothetical protein
MDTSAIVAIIVGGVLLLVVILVLLTRGGKKASGPRTCQQCRRAMLPAWERCMFCGWAPAARLEFILGPLAGQVISMTEELTTLGSVAGNTVVLADPAVSRKHAGIRRVEAAYELADFGRPASIALAVLIDRGGRELPIHADVVGKKVDVADDERVDVMVAELDERTEVVIVPKTA